MTLVRESADKAKSPQAALQPDSSTAATQRQDADSYAKTTLTSGDFKVLGIPWNNRTDEFEMSIVTAMARTPMESLTK